ncbi:MAG: hypothetical protein MJ058_10210, partial [Akkermansia sp.]|nr:hypothetical protein [Akkermansia sp.]
SGNSSDDDGGAIYGSTITLSGNGSVEFSGNSSSYGGAIRGSTITLSGNGSVTFSGNSSTSQGGAVYTASTFNLTGNGSVTFSGNYEKTGSGDSSTYRLRSVYANGGKLKLSAGAGQSITFYDALYANPSYASFNDQYEDNDGVMQKAAGDIVFSGARAEADLRALKPDYTQQELADSLTTEVKATTNLYGGTLRIEDGAVYKGHGITVAADSGATLFLRDAFLDNRGYDAALNSGNVLALEGANYLAADHVQMGDGTVLHATLGGGNAHAVLLTMFADWTLDGRLTIDITYDAAAAAAAPLRILNIARESAPTWWGADTVSVSGAAFDALQWSKGILYLNLTGGEIPLPPTLDWAGGDMRWNSGSSNWLAGGSPALYTDGCRVVFGDAGSGTVFLEIPLLPRSVVVDNSTGHDYTFSGVGYLPGTMQLTKGGEGSLTIDTANTYTGGTILNAGTLVAGNASAFGTGTIQINGGTLDLGGYAFTNDINIAENADVVLRNGTLSGDIAIAGAGLDADGVRFDSTSLTVANAGVVSFLNAMQSSGGAICGGSNSTITMTDNESVVFSGNTAFSSDHGGGAIYGGSSTITMTGNGSVEFSGNHAYDYGGAIYGGSSTITMTGNGSVEFSGNYAGKYGGAIYGLGNSTITLSDNESVEFSGNSAASSSSYYSYYYSYGGAIYGGENSVITLMGNGSV